ncbi:MAG: hypothetical protein Q8L05_01505 [Actinomycetota bacterium]|nr:hypothetical protein [Actinomycetota bacterium]MDP2287131.1 hypothetical protein [Actinomycetota bacterium]
MRKVSLVVFAVALSAVVASPVFAAGDPPPVLHGEAAKPTVAVPTQAPVPAPVATVAATPTPSAAPSSAAPAPAPVIDEASQRALEITYAKGDAKATDMHGVQDSLYRGKWFNAKDEDRRRCIVKRETGGNYESVSSGGTYRGAYQMNRALAVGATWMMQAEVQKELGDEPAALVPELRKAPTQSWNRYWQDRAFWTIWRNGAGAGHWRGAGC